MNDFFDISPEIMRKLIISFAIFALLFVLKLVGNLFIKRKVSDVKRVYIWRRTILYLYTLFIIIFIGKVWIKGIDSIATFLGLTSAGLAIAMRDTVEDINGWFFIMWNKPFALGDRIQVKDMIGDVIGLGFLKFSVVEVGNWVDGDQSTGRIIHIPNSMVIKESLINYHTGFEYIWNEIPVLITLESDWQKVKKILIRIAAERAVHLTKDAEEQLHIAARKYMIFFNVLTPTVYTSIEDSGIRLTIRYLVKPRMRRITEHQIYEDVLEEFAKHNDIDFAYPTTRFYTKRKPIA